MTHLRPSRWALLVVAGTLAMAGLAMAQQAEPDEADATAEEAPSSPLSRLPILRETLDNGLRVVMSPDPTMPTVALAVYYDVGSRNEVRGRSGFAHLFEHMMFQGSANVRKGEFFSLIESRGGSLNGTTSTDRTNYFESLPAHELALGLWLEADRMSSLAVTAENFENQRQVVMEERRQRIDNQPYAPSSLRINELAYGDYWPYSHSTIGDMQDLQNAPLEAVQEFYNTYYSPNNAVLSIAGDFDPAEAMTMVRRYFGSIERSEVPEYTPAEIQPQTAERKEVLPDPLASLPAFHVAYHIPPMRSEDSYPLELLGIVLANGDSSRLYQSLVKERELCQQISAGPDSRRGPDLFSFFGLMAEGHEPKEAQEIIFQTVDRIAQRGITPAELEKAKNKVRSWFVFGLQSNLALARELAEFEMYWGNAELLRTELERYLAVEADDVKRVAGQYFAATNRTILDVVTAEGGEASGGGGEGEAVPAREGAR